MNWRGETLIDLFNSFPENQQGYTFLNRNVQQSIAYSELHRESRILAGKLQAFGLEPGDVVILILFPDRQWAILFWAIIISGGIPCVLPPNLILKSGSKGKAHLTLDKKLQSKMVITTQIWSTRVAHETIMTPDQLCSLPTTQFKPVKRFENDVAIIQATSGSTSIPKCVMLSHTNLLANLEQIGRRLEVNHEDIVVSWLPFFHDMGLIGCFLFSTYWNLDCIFLPPGEFIRRPRLWLQVISDHRGTLSPAPNFAYSLANIRTPDELLKELDLSCWRSAMCGAEPIDYKVLDAFARRFATCGFAAQAITPCSGMAEASLCVSMVSVNTPMNTETILHDSVARIGFAKTTEDISEKTVTVVDCGPPLDGTYITILNDSGAILEDGCIGRIHVCGPSITKGYLNDAAKTEELLADGWFDTGDLGYLRNGHLFILGRSKELIIIRGQNYYPTDFERVAGEVNGVNPGRVVAVGIYNNAIASEALHIICEIKEPETLRQSDLSQKIISQVARQTGVPPAEVHFVPIGTIPRTTSGKLQRNALKQQLSAELSL